MEELEFNTFCWLIWLLEKGLNMRLTSVFRCLSEVRVTLEVLEAELVGIPGL
jgi:hypothetical protein